MPQARSGAGRNRAPRITVRFEHRLVLSRWLLSLFGVATFADLAWHMRESEFEGFTEDGISRFHGCLLQLFDRPALTNEMLLTYDENIVRHWRRITDRRNADGRVLYPRYFQYLCLLFTEIYLDRYFRDSDDLLADLNAYVDRFNRGETSQQSGQGQLFESGLPADAQVSQYTADDVRKLAYWSATGSGKTLLMHINILQYEHYRKLHGHENDINRIILLTPNEGLSRQHRDEFALSGMTAELFDKDAGRLFSGRSIEIIDIHKLRETSGDKTVAIDAFEGNNLVLVDEGHRGASSSEVGHWMRMRNRLCEKGFSFEYSATFGQAMKASGSRDLADEYAKCILFDYSYKYFYGDGYGKEYRILNLEQEWDDDNRRRYLTACLLTFYQQQRLYGEKKSEILPFLIEKPLWIFVGGSVTRAPTTKDVTDVVDILLFLGRFVREREESVRYLDALLSGTTGLHDEQGRDLFAGSFSDLTRLGLRGDAAYRDILATLFNAPQGGSLHVRRIKSVGEAEGEVALHVGGDNPPFGLINVGDSAKLCSLCALHQAELVVSDSDFGESLFRQIDAADSPINVLVGAKKFSEGWSSWRVSTMGLMNIGRSEGSQIIQLFGRGVRLKGRDFCLKRSRSILGVSAPRYLERLETLNVFGIRADYMRQFKEYLEDEGLPANATRIEFALPIVKNLGNKELKAVGLKKGINYKLQGPRPTLSSPDEVFRQTNMVVVDWYPRIQAMASARGQDQPDSRTPHEARLTPEHVALLDLDRLYFDLQAFKSERAWHNLSLDKAGIRALLLDNSWYTLLIPKEQMEFRSVEQIPLWQELASVLLRRYCDRFYKLKQAEWESRFVEYRLLTEEDSNFLGDAPCYRVLVDQSRQDILAVLQQIKDSVAKGDFRDVQFQGLTALMFDRHLYQPLIHVDSDVIEVRPVPLNDGEHDFVVDLRDYCSRNTDFFADKELYLLRNMSRGKGIGFFQAGNFYPDFILWLLDGGKQYINFVDPKGLRNLEGPQDPKIQFSKTIKSLERDLRQQDPDVTLNSFIIANTRERQVSWWGNGMTKEQFADLHVLFQKDDKDTYIKQMLEMTQR